MDNFKKFFKSFFIWFLVFYVILFGWQQFFGKKEQAAPAEQIVNITLAQKGFVIGNLMTLKVDNQTEKKVTFVSPCEKPGTLKIFYIGKFEEVDIFSREVKTCSEEDDIAGFSLEPKQSFLLSFKTLNQKLFSTSGKYRVEMEFSLGDTEGEIKTFSSAPFDVQDPGAIRQFFRAIISKPLFNALVSIVEYLPGHSFGWAIVILTILVRLILFIPNQKSMRSQREIQKLQPKIEQIKEEHKGNQQMIALKTMELYKTHKVNPMGSCLPLLLQMPVLFGIYYIVRDGLSPHLNYFLYNFNAKVDLSVVNTQFFGLDLAQKGTIILAILVGIAQWGSVALTLMSAKRKKAKEGTAIVEKKKSDNPMDQMQQMNKVMQWILPLMVAFFVTSFPAGVGIYWLTSTLFGITQQKYVNWQIDKPKIVRKEA